MNLALADIRHKLGRFVLTCLGLGLGLLMGVALSMVGIYQGVVSEALALSRSLRADLWVVESGTRGPFAEASRIPGDVREIVARLPGVAEAGAITLRTAEAQAPQGMIRVQVIGYEPGRPGGPSVIASGRGLGGARFDIVADASSGLPLGATLMLGRYRYHVVGTTRGLVSSGGDPLIFMHLRDSQDLQFRLQPRRSKRAGERRAQDAAADARGVRCLPQAARASVALRSVGSASVNTQQMASIRAEPTRQAVSPAQA